MHKQKIGELWFACWKGQYGAQPSNCKNNKPLQHAEHTGEMCNEEGSKKQTKQQSMVSPSIKRWTGENIQSHALCLLKPEKRKIKFPALCRAMSYNIWQPPVKPCFKWACSTYLEKEFLTELQKEASKGNAILPCHPEKGRRFQKGHQ